MKVTRIFVLCSAIAMVAGSVAAQEPVPSLQDLIGAKGRDGEYQMKDREYNFVRTEKSGDSAYSYWQGAESGQCVVVRTTDGRYASIVYAPYTDCQGSGEAGGSAGYDRKDEFETVCGVIVNGQTYAYKCKAVDMYRGSERFKTVLHYPDQTIHLRWKTDTHVEIHFEGMVAQHANYSVSEGETNWVFEGKTYYFYSDKGRARWEVEHFRN